MQHWNDRIKGQWDMTKSTPLGSAGTPVSGIRVKEYIPFKIVLSGHAHHFDYSQDSTWCYRRADGCAVFSDGLATFLFLSILVSSWFIFVGQIVKAKTPTSLFSTSRPCYKQFKHRLSGSRILWRYSLLYLKQHETGLLNFFFFFLTASQTFCISLWLGLL